MKTFILIIQFLMLFLIFFTLVIHATERGRIKCLPAEKFIEYVKEKKFPFSPFVVILAAILSLTYVICGILIL